jgi:DNA-binding NarL/FixJ family response regulator
MQYYNVYILEDSYLQLTALKEILASISNVNIVGTARTLSDAMRECEKKKPDLIIVDAKINNDDDAGGKFVRYIRRQIPGVRTLGLTYHADLLERLKQAGCDYVAHKALIESPENTKKFIEEALKPKPASFRDEAAPLLTDTEDKVLKLICEGYTENQIAEKLGFASRKSVKTVKQALFDSFGAISAPNLVHLAYKSGYLDPDSI